MKGSEHLGGYRAAELNKECMLPLQVAIVQQAFIFPSRLRLLCYYRFVSAWPFSINPTQSAVVSGIETSIFNRE